MSLCIGRSKVPVPSVTLSLPWVIGSPSGFLESGQCKRGVPARPAVDKKPEREVDLML